MKIVEKIDLPVKIGDKCNITVEQTSGYPALMSDPFEALFKGYSGSDFIKFQTKYGEFIFNINDCKLKTEGSVIKVSGKNGDLIIEF